MWPENQRGGCGHRVDPVSEPHERTFARAYELDFSRVPNRHITFGAGLPICLSRNLAHIMLWHSFEQLTASIESFELADVPVRLASNEIAGIVGLSVRTKLASRNVMMCLYVLLWQPLSVALHWFL
jgi:hypothetical protein